MFLVLAGVPRSGMVVARTGAEVRAQPLRVPTALRDQLGRDAALALIEMLHDSARQSIDDAIDRAAERFERRLAEELAKLRVEMAQGLTSLRQEIAEGNSALRKEFHESLTAPHTALLRWSLVLWTGQVVVLAALLRILR